MANVAVQLADGGGKEVKKSDGVWGWVKSLEKGTSSLATNAERIGGVIDNVGSVITSIFGGKTESNDNVSGGNTSLLPLLAVGGGLALLLR